MTMQSKVTTGARMSLHQVTVHNTVTDVWADFGLEEMPDEYLDSDVFGGSRIFDDEASDDDSESDVSVKRPGVLFIANRLPPPPSFFSPPPPPVRGHDNPVKVLHFKLSNPMTRGFLSHNGVSFFV